MVGLYNAGVLYAEFYSMFREYTLLLYKKETSL